MSPLSASPAVGVDGGGGAAPAGLFSAGSRPSGSCQRADLQRAAQPEAGCPADPGGPAGTPTGAPVKTYALQTLSHTLLYNMKSHMFYHTTHPFEVEITTVVENPQIVCRELLSLKRSVDRVFVLYVTHRKGQMD